MPQEKQMEWLEQWKMLRDDEKFLFEEWIQPNTLDDFKGKDVLECGCGGGQHTSFVAPYAKSVTAVDLNTTEVARERNKEFSNVTFVEADIAEMDLGRKFDAAFCIGVIHHTDFPDKTFRNIARHVKPGGRVIIWTYSKEGNFLVRYAVEPIRKLFLRHLSRPALLALSRAITVLLYAPVYSLYLLPMPFLPYYEYFDNFRKLSFYRNVLNVFDKLNAPQVEFTSAARARSWMSGFRDVHLSRYKGVSWRISGTVAG